jgi:hypothetical protein
MDRKIFVCHCGWIEHQMVWPRDEEGDTVTVEFHLSSRAFLRRLRAGIKFVLDYKSRYGEFDEIIVDVEKVRRLKDFLAESESLRKARRNAGQPYSATSRRPPTASLSPT